MATHAATTVSEALTDTKEHLKQHGGRILANATLAALALGGVAGWVGHSTEDANAASISFGRNVYINFNRNETKHIEHFQEAGYTGYGLGGIACEAIPAPYRGIAHIIISRSVQDGKPFME